MKNSTKSIAIILSISLSTLNFIFADHSTLSASDSSSLASSIAQTQKSLSQRSRFLERFANSSPEKRKLAAKLLAQKKREIFEMKKRGEFRETVDKIAKRSFDWLKTTEASTVEMTTTAMMTTAESINTTTQVPISDSTEVSSSDSPKDEDEYYNYLEYIDSDSDIDDNNQVTNVQPEKTTEKSKNGLSNHGPSPKSPIIPAEEVNVLSLSGSVSQNDQHEFAIQNHLQESLSKLVPGVTNYHNERKKIEDNLKLRGDKYIKLEPIVQAEAESKIIKHLLPAVPSPVLAIHHQPVPVSPVIQVQPIPNGIPNNDRIIYKKLNYLEGLVSDLLQKSDRIQSDFLHFRDNTNYKFISVGRQADRFERKLNDHIDGKQTEKSRPRPSSSSSHNNRHTIRPPQEYNMPPPPPGYAMAGIPIAGLGGYFG